MDGAASTGSDLLHADRLRTCALSANPVDRRVGGGVYLRGVLSNGSGTAAADSVQVGNRAVGCLRPASRRQRIRRSQPMGNAEKCGLHPPLFPERVEVSAVAVVSAVDAGRGYSRASLV